MRKAIVALLLGFALVSPAHAQSAQTLYVAGEFSAAAEAGEQEGGAAGNLIAARALLAIAISDLRASHTAACLDRAQRNAQAALAVDQKSVQARLQLATALGMKGRRASLKEALKADYAKRGRALIDEALELSPQEPWAHALLGGWHLEVVRRGGTIGSAFMGASSRVGMRAFDRAISLSPRDPAIAFHYALALLALDPERYSDKAGALLAVAANAAPRDAFERNVRDEARRLSTVLSGKGAMAAAATAADAYL